MADKDRFGLQGNSGVLEGRNRRRSQRVVLRVPVLLSALMPDGKKIEIQAQTMVVNAHGGLLDVGLEMIQGQKIHLCNIKTEDATTGRIVRVEEIERGRYSVAFEFDSPAPHFWPVHFLPADWSTVECEV